MQGCRKEKTATCRLDGKRTLGGNTRGDVDVFARNDDHIAGFWFDHAIAFFVASRIKFLGKE